MADLDDIEGAISEGTERIEKAINDRWSSLTYLFWGAVLYVLILYYPSEMWHSKTMYGVRYSVDSSKVQIQKRPHDCDFLSAPLGNKNCHYERQVSTVRWATSTGGQPIYSGDDGKTWNTFSPDDPKAVPKTPSHEP